jgi:SET domain-containing protein
MNFPDSTETPYSVTTSLIQGMGLFALRLFVPGERILEYVGEKISKAESLRRCIDENNFIFELDGQFDLDGNVEWNPARFANHSCSPNCVVELIDGHLWVIAEREIQAGEELTYNYGYDLVDYREHPCQCGSPACVGYILTEEFHDRIRRTVAH